MTARIKTAASEEIAAIEDLMEDLEKRLRRLSTTARKEASGAGGDVHDFVTEALGRITDRVRDTTSSATQTIADEAGRMGGDALKKFLNEVEDRPLIMLGIAAGLGFLFGLANRR